MNITNKNNLSLPLAVLFSYSDYDGVVADKTISATSLLKPLRSIILGLQNPDLYSEVDLTDMIPAVFGSAVHSYAQDAWEDPATVTKALTAMGINAETQKRVVINPKTVEQGQVPIYIERRSERKINGWTIRGKFDGCVDGKLFDYKTKSVWSDIFGSNDEDYKLQGSIYRWLNPTIALADSISVESVYTDWSSSKARADSKYPQLRVASKDFDLMSLETTGNWIAERLAIIDSCMDLAQADLPRCTPEELWETPTKYKYFKKEGAKRATKIYDSMSEASLRLSNEGCGEIRTFPGQIKRCNYCNVAGICTQAQEYINSGQLEL